MKTPSPPASPSHACAYLRSSKDRHDLSLDAQRRALQDYAHEQGLAIVAEFADAVESGKDDDRPGFQGLLRALRDPARAWSVILALDTSRIARRRHLALIFEHESEKAGVRILYKSVPDTDPITGMLLRSILQAMDEWHSLTSKAKGLAGMAESVKQGWRAGGQAPRGYRLEHQPTGTLRDGQPVMRSKLVPGPDAEAVATYLQARAAGKPRSIACQLSGLAPQTLNELEWQALTYAGHTTWGMHHEHRPGGYVGGVKRKPRAAWHITRDTHPPLISDQEAEAIINRLEAKAGLRTRAGDRVYLLSGLLVNAAGQPYAGETVRGQGAYRVGKGARISVKIIEGAVLDQLFADLSSPATAKEIAERMRKAAAPASKPRDLAALRRKLATLDGKIGKLVDMIATAGEAAPAYQRAIAGMEGERTTLAAELEQAATESKQAEVIRAWTAADVERLLGGLRNALETDLAEERILAAREAIAGLVEKIVLDLESRTWEIHYKLYTGVKLASPRGSHDAPVVWIRRGTLPQRLAA